MHLKIVHNCSYIRFTCNCVIVWYSKVYMNVISIAKKCEVFYSIIEWCMIMILRHGFCYALSGFNIHFLLLKGIDSCNSEYVVI